MWQVLQDTVKTGVFERYRFAQQDGCVLSYAQVLANWASSPAFAEYFSARLAACPFEAFLWETPPVSSDNLQRPFECVLVDSPQLARVKPDITAFAEHFEAVGGASTVTFDNLGGDARLIAPVPPQVPATCTHLAGFLRQAPVSAIIHLWQAVAAAVRETPSGRLLWISSCGLGVYWLHIRLDRFPKYYRYAPYRQVDISET